MPPHTSATSTVAADTAQAPSRKPAPTAVEGGSFQKIAADTSRRGSLIVVWIALFILFGLLRPDQFLTVGTLQTIFGSQQALVFIGLGALCAFSVGEFDFSVAAVAGLSATLVAVLVSDQGVNVWLAALIAVAAAVGIGAFNALLIIKIGINPIVTTLGVATLLTGVSSRISNGGSVFLDSPELYKVAATNVLGLPISFYYGLALAAIFTYVMTSTPLGRHMLFVGSNRSVARLAMVRVDRIRVGAYISSSLLCGVGGVLLVGTVGGFDPASASTYLLPALSATFLGTAVIQPGRFNPAGSMIAIYFLATGIVGLQLLGFAGWISDVFYGSALIIAIVLSTLFRRDRRHS
ncbi:ABC transporter permease [Actinocorallia sp. A-T 12471]|uniref:ABC transporter permease n=1 Tax=Actinocorallia sp. A-T 12471 TaxID=3089813 RepID=UPI0029D0A5B3|nr:ABC transporter permease [Actinocorallia sp. A-T 12471]MDX6741186.1 ABC transporter permease [Actinocorallia sp. A-T 12471]